MSDLSHKSNLLHEVQEGSSNRNFGFVFTIFFLIIALWPVFSGRVFEHPPRVWALGFSAAFLVVSLVKADLLAPLNKVWTKLGLLMAKVMHPIVFSFFFFVIFTPFALLFRLFTKNHMRKSIDRKVSSYWINRNSDEFQHRSMKHLF